MDEITPPRPAQAGSRIPEPWAAALVPVLVALATFAVFSGTLRNQFVNWDDNLYLLRNPNYRGLGWANLRWMFTTTLGGPYQPLCWLTFAFDYLIWGMNPAGYHLTNLLLHTANAVLCYAVALRLLPPAPDCGPGRPRIAAALAALLFAVHPLRVESVAWVTERKDVLSGFFYLLTVYAYLRQHADPTWTKAWKAVSWGAFALALLAKGMVITLPAALIILDLYPLRRLPGKVKAWLSKEHRQVWLEKLPLLVPALLIAIVGYAGQQRAGLILAESVAAHGARAVFGLTFYLWKTLWPVHLCPYESPVSFDPFAWPYLVSGAAVGIITLGAIMSYRRWPAVAAAWVYYAVTLAPVLGLVSFGVQLAADRYSYLACLPWPVLASAGLSLAWRRANAWGRRGLCLGAGLVLTGLMFLTWRQVGSWRDSETLWRHTIALRPQTTVAHHNLGVFLDEQGKVEEAISHYREALRFKPDYAAVHYNLGHALAGQGKVEEAIPHYREALRIEPAAEVHTTLADALLGQGKADEAIAQYREALRLKPAYAAAHNNLGLALAGQGRAEEAISHYREALRAKPDAEVHSNLGMVLARQGRAEEAIENYLEALRLKPDFPEAHNNCGVALAGQGRAREAITHYREALRLKPNYGEAHFNLGNTLAGEGKLDEAMRHYRATLRVSPGFEPARRNLGICARMAASPR